MPSKSWVPVPEGCHFPLDNIPFGIISTSASSKPRPAIAIGELALDLQLFATGEGFKGLPDFAEHVSVFNQSTLNAFATLGQSTHRSVRRYLQNVFNDETNHPEILKTNQALRDEALVPLTDVTNHLPMTIGDYTDFFAGVNHAFNVGTMFRGPANALQPNYKHLPVGYHGRSSSVVVSGTPIRRPCSQVLETPTANTPTFMASRRLDIELELGAFLCKATKMGDNIPIEQAEEAIFGYVLLNDWSARDIQTWEYVPLGPFNAKNFGTTISPWVVLVDALEGFRCAGIQNDQEVLPYLQEPKKDNCLNIELEVGLQTSSGTSTIVSRTNSSNLLWSFPQMIAHHSIGGCPMNVGDLLGSGTISGTEAGTYGSLLEACGGGKRDIDLANGETRKFLQDGDTVVIKGSCSMNGQVIVGFGDCSGTTVSAHKR
ncbi:hypothetical protein LTR72_011304 [Exophiala xenobiotica]|nr:hypothetical protein LTR72_011304 [Exophiala xenobiotica]KAK5285043.1 hypothetical protein LTR14_011283 [Exophiala xenobiotica]KAK5469173.1 hypothetical protein LTR55_011296 [Exophiala xenobiotica]